MQYNAGSEIYTQMLARELVLNGNNVKIFSREENPFQPDYTMRRQYDKIRTHLIPIELVNVARQKDRYQSEGVDKNFLKVVEDFNPEIIHFQHLNHLSLGLMKIAKMSPAKILFTLHDYWLACPRGQFVQINYGEAEPLKLCDGQEDLKCAEHCYSRYHMGLRHTGEEDVVYWTSWVRNRKLQIDQITKDVDLFIAPSHHLLERMKIELHLPDNKIVHLDYGFDLNRLQNRKRKRESHIVFGFIGTHSVPKGINHLIEAFSLISRPAILRIWGRPMSGITSYLKEIDNKIGKSHNLSIQWYEEYDNENIVTEVFNLIDVLVVPSIWDENSPLVIHEALQCRVPVITADHGGMKEYVNHKINGLLFQFRDINDLADKMEYFIENEDQVEVLGQRGYLQSESGNIVSMQTHVTLVKQLYHNLRGEIK